MQESEAITYSYERNPEDARIAHNLTLSTDELGNVLETVSIVYPRNPSFVEGEDVLKNVPTDTHAARKAKAHAKAGQTKTWITFTKNDFTNDVISNSSYYLRQGWQTRTYEFTGFRPNGALFTICLLYTSPSPRDS